MEVFASLLCCVCSRRWTKKFWFLNHAAIESHDFTKQLCKCGARATILVNPNEKPDAAGFENPIDDDESDNWKKQ